ncbi:HlyD family type I secretion periplasmic adaptor subunit [Erwinia endophytica]|uniref:HlyD family type I secretion periplasmic adaptor subunit n=1 Tax=Erwinia endophytica TaxID=1563158 RepID=UPI0012660512|nr:HlyD family type I secretion periplasmic adaptor subunit [Erwinia endophytica]KAB8312332.1 HlyD family type I secretion periplasmic adaptor subunit [Erwinia endophytica]
MVRLFKLYPVFFFIALFLFLFLKVDVIVHARGYIQIKDRNIIIDHPNGGRINKLYVRDGDRIKKGEIIAVVDNSYISEDYNKNKLLVDTMSIRKKRLESQINNTDFIINGDGKCRDIYNQEFLIYQSEMKKFQDQYMGGQAVIAQKEAEIDANKIKISGLKQALSYDETQVNLLKRMIKVGAASQSMLLSKQNETQRTQNDLSDAISASDVLKSELQKAKFDTDNIKNTFNTESQIELQKVQDQLNDAESKLKGANVRKEQEEIKSPVDGIIQKLTKSNEGAVIPPGGEILEITPTDVPMVASVNLETRDRYKIWPGMTAKLEVNGLEKLSDGTIYGSVGVISADSVTDNNNKGIRYYKVDILMDKNKITDKIYPGMSVDAYIIVGRRTILEYVINPIMKGIGNSFGETG